LNKQGYQTVNLPHPQFYGSTSGGFGSTKALEMRLLQAMLSK
jgi:hypothetical protein